MTSPIRYPEGLTPHGEYQLLAGKLPSLWLHSPGDELEFRLMGGLSAPFADPTEPAIIVKSLKGLIPPWQLIRQKGATQQGATTVGSLFDPCQVTAELEIIGPDPRTTARVMRDWIAANEQLETSELSWWSNDLGRWWANVRWSQVPPNEIMAAVRNRQKFTQVWDADDALWRSYDVTDSFTFSYDSDSDTFGTDHTSDLGTGWDLAYSGSGSGFVHSDSGEAVWSDGTGDRTVACRRHGFTTDTDNQVIEITYGRSPQWSLPASASNYAWGRMANSGTPGQDGIRLRVGIGMLILSYFVGGTETVMKQKPILPPFPGEKFSLVCGIEGNPLMFRALRNGGEVFSHVGGSGAHLGSAYRSAGMGMFAASDIGGQATPAKVRKWNAGDNNTVSQSGFIKLTNIGDQPMWPRYTCFGPGTFRFGDGPGSTDYIEFGPLLTNQVMQVRSDKEQRLVVDLSSQPASTIEIKKWEQALNDFLSFASVGNASGLEARIKSRFGIVTPQGNPLALLSGSFSTPIPSKPRGNPAQISYIPVQIDNGSADSLLVASGTPLRRYPL